MFAAMMNLIIPLLLCAADCAEAKQPAAVYFVLVGDSTVTDQAGWGKAFAERLAPGVRCTNTASGGQSSKSFYDHGRWAKALALKPTHVLIQFGHNDQPGKGPKRETDPKTTYRANLIRYIHDARAAGATPILVTSLVRRIFVDGKVEDTLAPYAEAAKAVAAEKHVPLVDLHARSLELVKRLGPVNSQELGPLTKEGKPDRTHLNEGGAAVTAELVVDELRRVCPELSRCFRNAVQNE